MTEGGFDSERLRALKEQSGLSWTEIAKRAGVTRGYLQDLVAGRAADTATRYLVGVARALEVSPLALLEGYSEDETYEAGWREGVLSAVRELQALRSRGP